VNRYAGFSVEPEPELDGPDQLLERAAKAHPMVPKSRVAEAVAAERQRIWEAIDAEDTIDGRIHRDRLFAIVFMGQEASQ
jgi:hypothetical protein